MSDYKITLNPLKNETFSIDSWFVTGEPPVFSVQTNSLSYHLVLGDKPTLHIYNLVVDPFTQRREIGEVIKSYELIGAANQVLSKI